MTLIERLQQADGPSRELDAEIARHTGHPAVDRPGFICPGYTASLDAAMMLVDLARYSWSMGEEPGPGPWAWVGNPGDTSLAHSAYTPALALCIAALSAQEASNG